MPWCLNVLIVQSADTSRPGEHYLNTYFFETIEEAEKAKIMCYKWYEFGGCEDYGYDSPSRDGIEFSICPVETIKLDLLKDQLDEGL